MGSMPVLITNMKNFNKFVMERTEIYMRFEENVKNAKLMLMRKNRK